MAEYIIQEETLINIADAIRSKTGSTGNITVNDMATQIEGITSGNSAETITGKIAFNKPDSSYVFIYEDGNGEIQQYNTNNSPTDGSYVDFTIRKNSMIVLHCPDFTKGSVHKAGLVYEPLYSYGSEVILVTGTSTGGFIVDAVCKVTDDFNLNWYEDEGPSGGI